VSVRGKPQAGEIPPQRFDERRVSRRRAVLKGGLLGLEGQSGINVVQFRDGKQAVAGMPPANEIMSDRVATPINSRIAEARIDRVAFENRIMASAS